jgi:hypothetical protein
MAGDSDDATAARRTLKGIEALGSNQRCTKPANTMTQAPFRSPVVQDYANGGAFSSSSLCTMTVHHRCARIIKQSPLVFGVPTDLERPEHDDAIEFRVLRLLHGHRSEQRSCILWSIPRTAARSMPTPRRSLSRCHDGASRSSSRRPDGTSEPTPRCRWPRLYARSASTPACQGRSRWTPVDIAA